MTFGTRLVPYTHKKTPFFILIKVRSTNSFFRRYYESEYLRDKAFNQLRIINSKLIPICKGSDLDEI